MVRADDDVGDLAPAGDEEAELAVDLPGDLRDLPGQLMGDDTIRRDAPPAELPDASYLGRPEAGQVAVNLLDGCSFFVFRPILLSLSTEKERAVVYLNLSGLICLSIPSRKADQAFVRKAAIRRFD